MDPDTDRVVVVSGLPDGSVSSTFTVTGTSSPGLELNTAVQVRVTVVTPKGGMGLGILLDSTTEVGSGTVCPHNKVD